MNRTKLSLTLLVLLVFLAGFASAEGAGGSFFQVVKPEWNPSFLPDVRMPYTLEYFGGYGYGVSDDGAIFGGFGFGFLDSDQMSSSPNWGVEHLSGGVGGMLVGARIVGLPMIHLDLVVRLGAGGVDYFNPSASAQDQGYAILYAEPYAELGLGFTRWMHLSMTVGYSLMANFVPGLPFEDFVNRSPTLGFTVTFGDFERPW